MEVLHFRLYSFLSFGLVVSNNLFKASIGFGILGDFIWFLSGWWWWSAKTGCVGWGGQGGGSCSESRASGMGGVGVSGGVVEIPEGLAAALRGACCEEEKKGRG